METLEKQPMPDLVTRAESLGLDANPGTKKETVAKAIREREALVIGRPLITSGAAGPDVFDLCRRLAQLGYETSVSRGENGFGVADETVLAAAARFRADNDIPADEADPQTPPEKVIGIRTWGALLAATND